MGVRFRCPNGHKLNVKSFLAGKRGICPKCGIRVQIPNRSQDDADSGSPAVSTTLVDNSTSPDDAASKPPTRVGSGGTAVNLASAVDHQVAQPAVARPLGTPVPVAQAATGAASGNPTVREDAISEAPDAVWYVRPPSGNQYGPASGDVIRRWVAEGRVTAECLVWREGWTDWRQAGTLFDNLQEPQLVASPSEVVPVAIQTKGRGRAKASTARTVTFVVVLAIASVVLLGALIYVTTVM